MLSTINGIRMRYDLLGPKTRPALVLVHGFPLTSALWEPQIQALSAEFRVLNYDLRGMGQSSLGPAPQPLEAYVDDLFALMARLRLKTAALCGLSMGGYIALRAIQREPDRFWALALCDTKADADSDEAKISRAMDIKFIRVHGPKKYAKGMLPKLSAPPSSRRSSKTEKGVLSMMQGNGADGMANALAAMAGRGDTHEAIRRYQAPILTLAGNHDLLIPPALGEAMALEARWGRCVLVPQAGHLSNLDAPEFFNRALLDFLRAIPKQVPRQD